MTGFSSSMCCSFSLEVRKVRIAADQGRWFLPNNLLEVMEEPWIRLATEIEDELEEEAAGFVASMSGKNRMKIQQEAEREGGKGKRKRHVP